jgi:hypothetical protein
MGISEMIAVKEEELGSQKANHYWNVQKKK